MTASAVAVVVAVLVPAVLLLVAGDRWRRAARTRRQLVDALAAVPEVAGITTPGSADQAAALAAAVARTLGLDRRHVAEVADAARLRPLADVVADGSDGPVAAARSVGSVTTESALDRRTGAVLDEALTAARGRAGRAAAIVRVVDTYQRGRGNSLATTSGALFATVARHHTGFERRAAEALVHVVQGDPPSA